MATHTYSHMVAHTYALSYTRGLDFIDDLRLMTLLPLISHCGHNASVFSAFVAGGTVVLFSWTALDPVASEILKYRLRQSLRAS